MRLRQDRKKHRRQEPPQRHGDSPKAPLVEKCVEELDLRCARASSSCAIVPRISSAFASKVRWNYNESKQANFCSKSDGNRVKPSFQFGTVFFRCSITLSRFSRIVGNVAAR